MTRRFTSSELRLFQRCRRQWYLRHHLGYSPKRDAGAVNAASVGTLYHKGIEEYYGNYTDMQVALAVVDQLVEENAAELEEAQRDAAATKVRSSGELVRIMLEGYAEWVEEEGLDVDLEVVTVEGEVEVEVPGMQGVTLLGKVDQLARRRSTGRIVIIDDKTCMTAADQQILAPLSQQFRHYALINLLQGTPEPQRATGALIRWARRVKRTARATPPFYGEVPVEYPVNVLRAYWRQTERLIREILAVEAGFVRDPGAATEQALCGPSVDRSCATMCAFRAVCPLLDDESTDAHSVLQWSYSQGDPLARYSSRDTEEDA